jgi:hypothetical protein
MAYRIECGRKQRSGDGFRLRRTARALVFDSSIYITALRTGGETALSVRRLAVDSPVWLSAVVL